LLLLIALEIAVTVSYRKHLFNSAA